MPANSSGPALNPPASTPPASTDAPAPADSAPATEEKEKQGAALGAPGPAWADLEGTDSTKHSLSDLAEAQVVAVVFTCNECPVAKAYEDRLVKLATDYDGKGVALVAINVNPGDKEDLPAMKQRAEEKGFTFAYLQDPSQQIARDYGATVTPHAFVLDKSRNVVYMGAIDDNQDESAVTQHYLRDAVDAALAGKAPEIATSKQFGCSIRYE